MNASGASAEWSADWASAAHEQRRAWRRASPDDRLRWLEEALAFARDAGALAADRRQRAAAARAWVIESRGPEPG